MRLITIDTDDVIDGDVWGDKWGVRNINGHSLTSIIMSPIWFCQKVKDMFNGLW